MSDEIVLYRSVASRSFTALWMLEELGVPYRTVERDLRRGENRDPAYLQLNPMGKVPTLVIGDQVVSENPAICLLLADRYGYGTLAPKLEDAARGPYMSWIVWATSALEPASTLAGHAVETKRGDWGFGFGTLERELAVLATVLDGSGFLAGDRFTAADVMVGSVVSMRLHTGELPSLPALAAYAERNAARPAFQTASKINWPPELFPGS